MNDTLIDTSTRQIVLSNWCARCHPKKEYAEYIYMGESMCESHFEEALYGRMDEIQSKGGKHE